MERDDYGRDPEPRISKDDEAYKAAKEEVESKMTNEDWQYLIENTSSGMAKAQYRKRLEQE